MAKNKPKTKTSSKAKNKHDKAQNTNLFLWSFSCFIVALLFLLFFFVDSSAVINSIFKQNLLGLFGVPAILIPFILIGIGVYIIKFKDKKKARRKAVFSFLSLCVVSAFVHLMSKDILGIGEAFSYAYANTIVSSEGGGFFGALFAVPLYALLHRIVAVIVLILIFFVLLSLILERSVIVVIWGFVKELYNWFSDSARDIDREESYNIGRRASEKVVEKTKNKKITSMSTKDIINEIEDIDIPIGGQFDIYEETPEKIDRIKSIKQKAKNIVDSAKLAEDKGFDANIDNVFDKMYEEENAKLTKEDKPQREANLTEVEKDIISSEIEIAKEEVRPYEFPSTELLNNMETSGSDSRQEMYKTANKLISVLENFGVKAKLLQVTPGPSVTRYEILPSTGVKLSKIVGLAEDLALNLAVPTVLVAPVPGKAAVGIEIPNKETGAVSAREILESGEFIKSKSKLTIALGKDIGGRVIVGDISKMPHLLIAGATGSGKSVCINTIVTSLLYKSSPEEVKLIMVDPKVVELGMYNGIPHLLIPVVTDPKKAAGALNWAVTEMMHRYDVFAENFVKNLEGYNQLMQKTGGEKMPQIVIIIDELADLMMVAAKEVEDYICRLAQLARAAGIHLIVATQRPTVDVITGLIKANIPSRIAFAVASQIDSRTIIDKSGAEKLLGRGDMLYVPQGARTPIRVQGAFVSDDEIERLMDFLKSQNEDSHYSEDLAEHIERVAIGDNGVTPDENEDGDELLPKAIELAVELGQISTAMIQRRLKVGYSRAGRIIDQMEDRGIISSANGSKPRQVYINHSDIIDNYSE